MIHQVGFTKFQCYFLPIGQQGHLSTQVTADRVQGGMNNVKWEPLLERRKVLVPPLGIMKQFVAALDKESASFRYLQDFFPAAKVKTVIPREDRESSVKKHYRSGSGFPGESPG